MITYCLYIAVYVFQRMGLYVAIKAQDIKEDNIWQTAE